MLQDLTAVWVFYFTATLVLSMYLAPLIAAAHAVVGPNARASVSASIYFVLSIIGLGFGPVFVGLVSNNLQPLFADQSCAGRC